MGIKTIDHVALTLPDIGVCASTEESQNADDRLFAGFRADKGLGKLDGKMKSSRII